MDPVSLAVGIGLTVASSALKGIGGYMQADANYEALKQEAQIQKESLEQDKRLAYLAAEQQVLEREIEDRALRASNVAYIAASGGENLSFTQGIDPANRRALARDLNAIALSTAGEARTIDTQIRVNAINVANARESRKYAALTGVANTAASVGSGIATYQSYQDRYKTPDGGN